MIKTAYSAICEPDIRATISELSTTEKDLVKPQCDVLKRVYPSLAVTSEPTEVEQELRPLRMDLVKALFLLQQGMVLEPHLLQQLGRVLSEDVLKNAMDKRIINLIDELKKSAKKTGNSLQLLCVERCLGALETLANNMASLKDLNILGDGQEQKNLIAILNGFGDLGTETQQVSRKMEKSWPQLEQLCRSRRYTRVNLMKKRKHGPRLSQL